MYENLRNSATSKNIPKISKMFFFRALSTKEFFFSFRKKKSSIIVAAAATVRILFQLNKCGKYTTPINARRAFLFFFVFFSLSQLS